MMQDQPVKERSFVPNVLPWIMAVAVLIVYLLTINHWLSLFYYNTPQPAFGNLSQVAKVSGWNWLPELNAPALYLVTLPLHLLPVKWIPLALNLFSALCAGLTVYQLARSVALLPHDRTHQQRLREHGEFSLLSIPLAWLPPFLAVLVCGFQLTFWEHATNGTSEMFDLLLFAYVIRSLLEYRVDGRDSRLYRAAFVYGVGMTNNFAMVGFFPAFIAAIVWIRGLSFFNISFLSRMALYGLIGLLLYLLLPLLALRSNIESFGFWVALKANLAAQKNILFLFPKKTALIFSLTSLLPAFVVSIRWPSYFGDTSKLGTNLATLMFHVVHAVFLFTCVWMFFDPLFSPRQKGFGISFLTFYYLGALSIGYFSGYFLLVFRQRRARGQSPSPVLQTANLVATTLLFVLLFFVPIALAYKNLPEIRTTNGPILKEFAAAQTEGLSKGGALLSDDWRRILIAQSWLARDGRDTNFLFLDTQSLKWPSYHRYLHAKYPQKWELPPDDVKSTIPDVAIINRVTKLAKDTDVYYLHPSFGYYFEVFYPQPHGLVLALKRFEAATLLPPRLTPELVGENESFWAKSASQTLKPILATTNPNASEEQPSLLDKLFKKLGVPPEQNAQNALLGTYYSRSLNSWGVEMQKLGELEKAAAHFDLALHLNPENVVARVNLECNKNLRSGTSIPVTLSKSLEESFGKYRTWQQVLNANGPYDEPTLCYAQAWVFMQTGLYRQSARYFDRVLQFLPDNFPSRLSLAQIYLLANLPDNTLALTKEVRDQPKRFKPTTTNLTDLVAIEASAWYAKKNPEKARELLETEVNKNPYDDHLLANAVSVYTQRGDLTNALSIIERRLKLNPDNPAILINKAYIYIQLQDFEPAIQVLSRAMSLEPENQAALLNRAIANLRAGHLDDSKKDYETLEKLFPSAYQIQYGLGEIAWQQKDTNAAILRYEAYLTNATPSSAEAKFVAGRLKQIKGQKAK